MEENTTDILERSRDSWKDNLRIADAAIPAVSGAFLGAVRAQQRAIDTNKLKYAIAMRNAVTINDVLRWDISLEKLVRITDLYRKTSMRNAKKVAGAMGWNDPKGTYAYRYINEDALARLTPFGINNRSIEAIKYGMKIGFDGKITNDQLAFHIKHFIGVDKRQYMALLKYEAALYKEGLPPNEVKKLVLQQQKRYLQQRAMNIARTETLSASNFGALAAYQDAADRGVLERSKYMLGWLITPDDRLCDICNGMKDEVAEIGGLFRNGLRGPPLHPQCRCCPRIIARR